MITQHLAVLHCGDKNCTVRQEQQGSSLAFGDMALEKNLFALGAVFCEIKDVPAEKEEEHSCSCFTRQHTEVRHLSHCQELLCACSCLQISSSNPQCIKKKHQLTFFLMICTNLERSGRLSFLIRIYSGEPGSKGGRRGLPLQTAGK